MIRRCVNIFFFQFSSFFFFLLSFIFSSLPLSFLLSSLIFSLLLFLFHSYSFLFFLDVKITSSLEYHLFYLLLVSSIFSSSLFFCSIFFIFSSVVDLKLNRPREKHFYGERFIHGDPRNCSSSPATRTQLFPRVSHVLRNLLLRSSK